MTAAVVPTPAHADGAAATAAARRSAIPWSAVALAVPALVGVARLIISIRRPYDHWGDQALFEAAIRRVASGTEAVGPYSRFGFHQPGPAYFEAQAPFYWVSGGSPRSLFLGALCINLGSALGSVLLIRRFFGEGAARWTSILLGAYLVGLTPALLADPWPVYVLALPLLLTMLLAAAATRSLAARAGALVGASYVIQTHVATAATLVSIFATVGAMAIAIRTSRRRAMGGKPPQPSLRGLRRGSLLAAIAVLTLMWLPPMVQQATQDPGNLTTLARFFTRPHPEFDEGFDHSVQTSAGQIVRQLTLLPIGRRSVEGPVRPLDVAVAAGGLLVAAGLVIAGWRRRDGLLSALGAIPLAGVVAAVWSSTRIVGEIFPYLLLWCSVLILPAWIGAGIVVGRSRFGSTAHRFGAGALAVALVAATAAASWSMLRAPSPPLRSATDVTAAGKLTRRWVAAHDVKQVRVLLSDHEEWPLAAGLVDHLDREGMDVTVALNYVALFGDQFTPTDREDATVWLTRPDETPPFNEPIERLGDAGRMVVWAGLGPPG